MADKKLNIKVRTDGAKRAKKELKGVEGGMARMGKAAAKAGAAFFAARSIISGLQKVIELSTKFEGVERGFNNLTKAAGFSAKTFDSLQKATDGTVDSVQLMTQANNAMLLGIFESDEQMVNMFDTAQRLAQALGKDATFGIESLVTGMGRQSKLMLDNLGIMVKTEDAYKEFAKTLGVTVSELTDQQRKQAFVNATIKEANKLVSTLGEEQLTTADAIKQMKSSVSDAAIALGNLLSPVIVTVANTLRDAAKWSKEFLTGLNNLVEFGDVGGLESIKEDNDLIVGQYNKMGIGVRELKKELIALGIDTGAKEFKDALKDADGMPLQLREQGERYQEIISFAKQIALEKRHEVDILRDEQLPLLKEVLVPEMFKASDASKKAAEFASQTAISLGTSAIMGDNVTESLKRAVIQLGLMVAQAKLFDFLMDTANGFTPGGFLSTAVNFLFGKSPTQSFPTPNGGGSKITINQNFGGMGVIDHNFAANSIIPAINKAISTGQARIG